MEPEYYTPTRPLQNRRQTVVPSQAPRAQSQAFGARLQAQAGQSPLQTALQFMGTPGGAGVIGAVGAGFQAAGQRASEQADRTQRAEQVALDALQNEQADQRTRATSLLSQSPLGEAQEFAGRHALMASLLPLLRNTRSTPGDPAVAAAMGSRAGGFRLLEGGLPPELIARMHGDSAIAESIGQRDMDRMRVDPSAQATNLDAFGISDPNLSSSRVQAFHGQQQKNDEAERARRMSLIQRALDRDVTGERQPQKKKSGGIGGFFKGLARVASPFVSFIPGVGPLAKMGIDAGLAKASGGSWKDAGMAGAMSYGGSKLQAKLPQRRV